MLGKLGKLRQKGLREFKDRGLQAGTVFAERLGLSSQTALPDDQEFLQLFTLPQGKVTFQNFFQHFRGRRQPELSSAFHSKDETIRSFRRSFPDREVVIAEESNQICEGVFDLLGYSRLRFGTAIPDWHYDPISRKKTDKLHWSKVKLEDSAVPADGKIIWELNRHQYLTTLGQAYWLTDDEKYAETILGHLENWFDENTPKAGVNWLSSLEIAFRSMSWIWAFHLFENSPRFTSSLFIRLLKFLYLNGRHIESFLSTYSSPNTHLTGEALGLYFLGSFMPEINHAKRWKKLGYDILMDALDFQVRPDGVYCEQSSHYHRYTTDFYITLFILRELEGEKIEEKHREKLSKLLDFLMHITQPNGETTLFGDEDGGRLNFLDERPISDFRPALAAGAVLLEREDLKFVAREPSTELLWLLGVDGLRKFDELVASTPAETSKAFRDGGFFAIRDSWDDDASFMLIDCGPHGFMNGGHAHADALSFVLSVCGEPVFVDSGTYKYAADLEARQLFRSTSAHNCLTVNGESSSVPGGAWDWKSTANCKLLEWDDDGETVRFRGTHDGYERFGVRYERAIVFQRRGPITITDSITSNKSNAYGLNFILDPRCEAEISGQSVSLFINKNGRSQLLTMETNVEGDSGKLEGRWKTEPWFVSPRYGAKIESRKLVYSLKANESFQIRNIIRPA